MSHESRVTNHESRITSHGLSLRFVLAAAMADCLEEARREVARISPLIDDWSAVVNRADRHGLLPVVYRYLAVHSPDMVPDAVAEELRSRYRFAVAANIRLIGQLFSVMKLLGGRGITVMPYKGPVLSLQLYGDACLRPCCDIDFLVSRADARKARDMLVEAGYETEVSVRPHQEDLYVRQQCEYTLRHGKSGLAVELHWEVAQKAASFGFTARGLWNNPVTVALEGREVRTPAPEDMALVMAIHNGAKHQWERLLWVVDFGRLMMRIERWGDVMERARSLGMRRSLLMGCLLARDLTGVALPDEVERACRGDGVAALLAAEVRARLLGDEGAGGATGSSGAVGKLGHLRFSLRLREGLWSKARFCYLQLFTASHWELADMNLPAPLAPLYGLAKVWKWMRRS